MEPTTRVAAENSENKIGPNRTNTSSIPTPRTTAPIRSRFRIFLIVTYIVAGLWVAICRRAFPDRCRYQPLPPANRPGWPETAFYYRTYACCQGIHPESANRRIGGEIDLVLTPMAGPRGHRRGPARGLPHMAAGRKWRVA